MCKAPATEVFSFPSYLLAKQTVDDRALNKDVLAALRSALEGFAALRVIEIGAGIGTMAARLLRWNILPPQAEYILLDEMAENITFAQTWLSQWGKENGWQAQVTPAGDILLERSGSRLTIQPVQADVFDYIRNGPAPGDLLIAHAFLDLLPLPEGLPQIFSLVKPGGLAWLTLNFDGVTTLEPPIDPDLDAHIERLYHQTMEARPGGGDSRSGRHLFRYVEQAGGRVEAAGASDWVVFPQEGAYPADESRFLLYILHFFEQSLGHHADLPAHVLTNWLRQRRKQVQRGELIYIAHQMDFLCRAAP